MPSRPGVEALRAAPVPTTALYHGPRYNRPMHVAATRGTNGGMQCAHTSGPLITADEGS